MGSQKGGQKVTDAVRGVVNEVGKSSKGLERSFNGALLPGRVNFAKNFVKDGFVVTPDNIAKSFIGSVPGLNNELVNGINTIRNGNALLPPQLQANINSINSVVTNIKGNYGKLAALIPQSSALTALDGQVVGNIISELSTLVNKDTISEKSLNNVLERLNTSIIQSAEKIKKATPAINFQEVRDTVTGVMLMDLFKKIYGDSLLNDLNTRITTENLSTNKTPAQKLQAITAYLNSITTLNPSLKAGIIAQASTVFKPIAAAFKTLFTPSQKQQLEAQILAEIKNDFARHSSSTMTRDEYNKDLEQKKNTFMTAALKILNKNEKDLLPEEKKDLELAIEEAKQKAMPVCKPPPPLKGGTEVSFKAMMRPMKWAGMAGAASLVSILSYGIARKKVANEIADITGRMNYDKMGYRVISAFSTRLPTPSRGGDGITVNSSTSSMFSASWYLVPLFPLQTNIIALMLGAISLYVAMCMVLDIHKSKPAPPITIGLFETLTNEQKKKKEAKIKRKQQMDIIKLILSRTMATFTFTLIFFYFFILSTLDMYSTTSEIRYGIDTVNEMVYDNLPHLNKDEVNKERLKQLIEAFDKITTSESSNDTLHRQVVSDFISSGDFFSQSVDVRSQLLFTITFMQSLRRIDSNTHNKEIFAAMGQFTNVADNTTTREAFSVFPYMSTKSTMQNITMNPNDVATTKNEGQRRMLMETILRTNEMINVFNQRCSVINLDVMLYNYKGYIDKMFYVHICYLLLLVGSPILILLFNNLSEKKNAKKHH